MKTNKSGKLIGVSLGPGDPEWITRGAWMVLESNAHWCYPVRREGAESFALDIVNKSGLTPRKGQTPLIFPMTHDKAKLAGYWHRAAETVLEILRRGEDVAFLVEGDASTYATFGHLARTVEALDASIEVRVIPGVTSYNAAAAATSRPLADSDDTIAVLPAGYGIDMIERLLADFDTLVLLKVKPIINELIELVERRGLQEECYFVERVGTDDERVLHDITQLRDTIPNYLSLMIIHNPGREREILVRGCRKGK